jgi:hypothetical protein
MAKGKGATARYRAMLADVQRRVDYAFCSGNPTNPYPIDDKRHARFGLGLAHTQRVDADFRDTMAMMGGDPDTLVLRTQSPPGPVETLEVLGERWQKRHGQHPAR